MKIDRRIDEFGNVVFSTKGAVAYLYSGGEINDILVADNEEVERFNRNALVYGLAARLRSPRDRRDQIDLSWQLPEPYASLDIEAILFERCARPDEQARVATELQLYEQHGLYDLLRALHYLVEVMRKHNIVWGVGRGSSVASYVLFLLGVHKIDSLHYGLDIL